MEQEKSLESFYITQTSICKRCGSKICKCKAHEELQRRGWKIEHNHRYNNMDLVFPNGDRVHQLINNGGQSWNLVLRVALVVQHGIDTSDQLIFTMECPESGMWNVAIRFAGCKEIYNLFRVIKLEEALILIETINHLHESFHNVDHSWLHKYDIHIPQE